MREQGVEPTIERRAVRVWVRTTVKQGLPNYSSVENEIGISSDVDDIKQVPAALEKLWRMVDASLDTRSFE